MSSNSAPGEAATRLEELRGNVGKTAGARHTASRRLHLTDSLATWGLVVASLAILGVSLWSMFEGGEVSRGPIVEISGVLGGVATLAIGLQNASSSYGIRAERLHRAAMALDDLERRMNLWDASEPESNSNEHSFVEEYKAILESYDENHTTADYRHYLNSRKRLRSEMDIGQRLVAIVWYALPVAGALPAIILLFVLSIIILNL